MGDLNGKIKDMIVRRLNLRISPADIRDAAPLFTAEEGGLGLDSIDALDLAVGLFEEFEVEVTPADMAIFQSVDTMAAFCQNQKAPSPTPIAS